MANESKPNDEARRKRTEGRKVIRRDANEARHTVNAAQVVALGIPARNSEHTKTRIGRDGKTFELVVVKKVRPSILLRSAKRAAAA